MKLYGIVPILDKLLQALTRPSNLGQSPGANNLPEQAKQKTMLSGFHLTWTCAQVVWGQRIFHPWSGALLLIGLEVWGETRDTSWNRFAQRPGDSTICKLALTVTFLTCCFTFQTLGLARQNYQVWLAIFNFLLVEPIILHLNVWLHCSWSVIVSPNPEVETWNNR